MQTLGVDLASQPKKTGVCLLRWGDGRASVEELALGGTDEKILDLAAGADAVGIDAPFGWPTAFVEFVGQHHAGELEKLDWSDSEVRQALTLRRTDRWCRDLLGRRAPLSVSTDKIAMPAMRCAGLLARLGVSSRSLKGPVYEVYPAAALHVWLGKDVSYKGADRVGVLGALVDELQGHAPWLELPDECRKSDDLFDAIVCALIARAAHKRQVHPVPLEFEHDAEREGWIAIPTPRSLDDLV